MKGIRKTYRYKYRGCENRRERADGKGEVESATERDWEEEEREKHEIGGEEVFLYALEEGSTEAGNATVQTDLWEKGQT